MMRARLLSSIAEIPLTIWFMGLGCFINISGLSLLWPVNAIYIHVKLHQSMTVAGLVLMVYSGSGFLGSFIGGWLYDRIGAIQVLSASLLIGSCSILLPVVNHTFFVYVFVMAVFGMVCAVPFPVLSSLAGHAWPEGGRRAFNFLYVANNLGVAVGTALGGVLAEASFRTIFLGISLAYMVFMVLVLTIFRKPFNDVYQHATKRSKQKDFANMKNSFVPWGALSALFIGFILAWAVYVQWQAVISVYMQSLGFSLPSYSVLWTLNGILIFVSQPFVAIVVKRLPSLTIQMVGGIILFAVSFAVLLYFRQYTAFVIAMILTTLGEIFVWPAIPAAVARVSPPNKTGMLQGLVSSAATFGRMVGPLAGGFLYDLGSIHLVLLWGVTALLVPLVLFFLFHSRVSNGSEHPDIQTYI